MKKNPQSPTFTNLGVITKGTIVEVRVHVPPSRSYYSLHLSKNFVLFLLQVNISELGLVTQSGKVIWGKITSISSCNFILLMDSFSAGKYAQVTNNPENDGCINAVLLV